MKTIDRIGAQGDVLFRRVPAIPKNAKQAARTNAPLVIAHSETGHHHAIDSRAISYFEVPGDPLVCYLRMDDGLDVGGVEVVHHRAWDTHETLKLLGKPGDVWEVRRQREWTPEGWRRVED